MARADGSVWKHLAGNISAHYDRLSMLLLASTHPDPVMRILLTLSRLHRFNDGAVHFPVTQSELAEMASLSRNTANRALRRLVSGGVVEAGYGWLRIADPGALDHALAGISGRMPRRCGARSRSANPTGRAQCAARGGSARGRRGLAGFCLRPAPSSEIVGRRIPVRCGLKNSNGRSGRIPMRFLTAAAAAAALSLTAGAASAACDDGETVIKFSHVTNTDKHPKGIAASLLMERVNEEMDGKACMEVYPNSTLYNDDQVLEAMLNGDVHLAAPSLSKFEKYTKVFRIFDLPFMFKNIEAVDAFQASEIGQSMKESMMRRGLLGLQFWHNGMKQFSANRPLLDPSDAEG